jgi:Carboxypeptidase regulatory-like domain
MMSRFWSSIPRLAVALLIMSIGALLYAQSTTDGAIGGTVYDSNGAVVANAKIVVRNNGTNAEKSLTTNDAGYYRVINLPSGTYTVTINQQGFSPFKAEQVIVQVGSVTDVSPRLSVGGTSETVDVAAEAPQINTTSGEFAPTLNQIAISNLPINGGRWSNFALLTPGVVSDSNGFGLLSFRGISTLLNNNTVDGADNNQAFFSEERGRTRAGYSTPKSAIEEFQVNTSNYSSEYGRSAGGVINTVTKSGTNGIHGETYFYDRDNVWGAANAFTAINVQTAPGVFTSQNFKPTDWRKMAGGAVGGPVIKDKLFFFMAYDWYDHNFPGVAVATNPAAFFATQTTSSTNIATLAKQLNNTASPTAAQLSAALATYNTDLAGLNTMLGQVQRDGTQNIFLPKIDWNISSKNHASFSFNRMRWSSPAGIQTGSTVTRGTNSFGNDFVKDTWGVAKLNTFFTPTLGNELRFQYGRDFEYEFSQQPSAYELANLVNAPTFHNPLGLPPSVSITNAFTFGVPNFLQRSQFPDETRTQIADTMTWTHGKHNLKYGVDFSHVDDNSQNLFSGFGVYSYSSLVSYMTDLNVQNGCSGKPCYSSFTQGLGLPGLDFATKDYSVFVQDDWKIMPRLSLSLGLRWEYEQMPSTVASLVNPAVPQTAQLPSDKNNFGPRVGFAWDIFGNSKTVLRGGYGIYYGRIINSTIFNALIVTGMPGSQVSATFTPSTAGAPLFPQILTNLTGAGKSVDYFDSNFQAPQIHQIDLTLEREVGWGTVVSVSYLGSLGRQLPNFADTNICTAQGQGAGCTNPIQTITYQVFGNGPIPAGTTFTEPLYRQRINPNFSTMTDIFSGTNSSYHALVAQVSHRMSHNIQFNANYTWSHAIDFGQNQATFSDTNDTLLPINLPNAIAAEKGNSIYDIPNRFVVNAVITSPWKKTGWLGYLTNDWEVAPIYQVQNGLPLNLVTSGSPAILTGTTLQGGLGSGINGSGGATRLEQIGRNNSRLPLTWVQDIRLSKSFTFQERYKVELMADAFNIANKQNISSENGTGFGIVNPSVIAGNPTPCSGASTTAVSCLNFSPTFGTPGNSNNNFVYSPRELQLGVRVHF